MTYLSICAIYRDEGPYLREWVEFHRLVGVERFFLYNNESSDDHREVLAPLIEEGIVAVKDWPGSGGQWAAYDDCLAEHRDDTRWIAFIDLDEFLFSPTGVPLSDVLRDFEQWPGVGVYRLRFGASGHRVRPEGLVIENYTRRGRRGPYLVKSIVDPRRTTRCLSVHVFEHTDGVAVDEKGRPLIAREGLDVTDPQAVAFTERYSTRRLCVNHYLTRSEEEFRRKVARPKGDPPDRPEFEVPVEKVLRNSDVVEDDTIVRYAPALRSALARRPAGAGND
jgi:hypothetical protein